MCRKDGLRSKDRRIMAEESSKAWFPMRVTYQREMKVKAELDRLGIENFVPMRYKVVDGDTDNPHR